MSMESDLVALLEAQCPRVYPDVAPQDTARPYVTWQGLGGRSLRMLDNSAADKRHTYLQITIWDDTRAGALTLIRAIEDALCASSSFTATPEGEPLSMFEPEPDVYGSLQRFSIYAIR
jgi:hypothetical protein